MSDIVERLRRTLLDRDNFLRTDSERWLPVGLAKEAAEEIERLTREEAEIYGEARREFAAEIERQSGARMALITALQLIAHQKGEHWSKGVARRALEGK